MHSLWNSIEETRNSEVGCLCILLGILSTPILAFLGICSLYARLQLLNFIIYPFSEWNEYEYRISALISFIFSIGFLNGFSFGLRHGILVGFKWVNNIMTQNFLRKLKRIYLSSVSGPFIYRCFSFLLLSSEKFLDFVSQENVVNVFRIQPEIFHDSAGYRKSAVESADLNTQENCSAQAYAGEFNSEEKLNDPARFHGSAEASECKSENFARTKEGTELSTKNKISPTCVLQMPHDSERNEDTQENLCDNICRNAIRENIVILRGVGFSESIWSHPSFLFDFLLSSFKSLVILFSIGANFWVQFTSGQYLRYGNVVISVIVSIELLFMLFLFFKHLNLKILSLEKEKKFLFFMDLIFVHIPSVSSLIFCGFTQIRYFNDYLAVVKKVNNESFDLRALTFEKLNCLKGLGSIFILIFNVFAIYVKLFQISFVYNLPLNEWSVIQWFTFFAFVVNVASIDLYYLGNYCGVLLFYRRHKNLSSVNIHTCFRIEMMTHLTNRSYSLIRSYFIIRSLSVKTIGYILMQTTLLRKLQRSPASADLNDRSLRIKISNAWNRFVIDVDNIFTVHL
jgi:hypothetical protein